MQSARVRSSAAALLSGQRSGLTTSTAAACSTAITAAPAACSKQQRQQQQQHRCTGCRAAAAAGGGQARRLDFGVCSCVQLHRFAVQHHIAVCCPHVAAHLVTAAKLAALLRQDRHCTTQRLARHGTSIGIGIATRLLCKCCAQGHQVKVCVLPCARAQDCVMNDAPQSLQRVL